MFQRDRFHNFKVMQVLSGKGDADGRDGLGRANQAGDTGSLSRSGLRGMRTRVQRRKVVIPQVTMGNLSWEFRLQPSEATPRDTKGTSNERRFQENTAPTTRMTTSEAKHMPALSHGNEKQMSCCTGQCFLPQQAVPDATSKPLPLRGGRLRTSIF